MLNKAFTKKYTVIQNELNEFDQISIHGILDFFQDIAGRHAKQTKTGFADTNKIGVNWILARTRFEVLLPWEYLTDINVKTWPHLPERFEIERDYQLIDSYKRIMVKGSSTWVLLDNKTHSLAKTDLIYSKDDSFIKEKNFSTKMSSLKIDNQNLANKYEFTVTRHQLDHNMHMNNSRYGEECDNIINLDNGHFISYFEINYIAPSFLGEKLTVLYKKENDIIYGIFFHDNEIRSKFKIIISKK